MYVYGWLLWLFLSLPSMLIAYANFDFINHTHSLKKQKFSNKLQFLSYTRKKKCVRRLEEEIVHNVNCVPFKK